MSYCRWSSDWFRCDLYCYEDVAGGFTTHVAVNRSTHVVPADWDGDERCDAATWFARHQELSRLMEGAPRVRIGLPHDGETFRDGDLRAFLARVESLRAMGYRVPDSLIAAIKEEMQMEEEDDA